MSMLDQKFRLIATRGLTVQPEPMPGESTLEPGYVWQIMGEPVSTIVGIAAHPIADVVGKRIALKVVEFGDNEPPLNMPLHVATPDGQLIEGLDGLFADWIDLGPQEIGSYHEWICDPEGNWLLVMKPMSVMPPGQLVVQGIPIVIQGVPVVVTPVYRRG